MRSSGLFDAEFYARQNPRAVADGADPLEHFCRTGWKQLLRPRPDFDVWWYWTNYLDPASDEVNPFVHYVSHGPRSRASAALPVSTRSRPAEALVERRTPHLPVRRATTRTASLDETVVRYVRELSRFADVYYLADGYLPRAELAKLDGLVTRRVGDRARRLRLRLLLDAGARPRRLGRGRAVRRGAARQRLLLPAQAAGRRVRADGLAACDWWGLQATKGLVSTAKAPSNSFTDSIPIDVGARGAARGLRARTRSTTSTSGRTSSHTGARWSRTRGSGGSWTRSHLSGRSSRSC